MNRRTIPYVLALIGLTGCDTFYGVDRFAVLKERPDLKCIEAAIKATPGIADVQYQHYEGGTTLTGKSPASVTDDYSYRGAQGSHITGIVQIMWDYTGNLQITDHLMEINRKPPQEDIDATRPVMKALEERLEKQCGIVGLAASIKEACRGVECT